MDKDNVKTEKTGEEIRKEAVKTLDAAFSLLSAIPVSGDYVDIMAETRRKLRHTYNLVKESEKESESDGR